MVRLTVYTAVVYSLYVIVHRSGIRRQTGEWLLLGTSSVHEVRNSSRTRGQNACIPGFPPNSFGSLAFCLLFVRVLACRPANSELCEPGFGPPESRLQLI